MQTARGIESFTRPVQPPPNIVYIAAEAARGFGSEAEPLKQELHRIAADKTHPRTGIAAKLSLSYIEGKRPGFIE
jgi:hypothetical protein